MFFASTGRDIMYLLGRGKACLESILDSIPKSTRPLQLRLPRPLQWSSRNIDRRSADPRTSPAQGQTRSRAYWVYGPAAVLIAAAAALAGSAYWALHDLSYEALTGTGASPVVVLEASDGELLLRDGAFRAPDAPLETFPQHTIQAVLTIEDRRFWEHLGIDWRGIARAAVNNLWAGRVVEGGSTITQQLVKIRHLEPERRFRRKVQEAVLAFLAEKRMGKPQILERYLNEIYMGSGAHGLPAAARRYFDKEVADLGVDESAMLAGIIRAPARLNPLVNLEAAQERAKTVIAVMAKEGHLRPEEAEEAVAKIERLQPAVPSTGGGNWFADWAIVPAREVAGTFRGPVTVRTTLDLRLQAVAEDAVNAVLDEFGAETQATEAALVAMRPDGAVVAMVGGRDYAGSKFNRAVQARRQPGSTFKLFVYLAALKAGLAPASVIEDAPVDYDGYVPNNFGERYSGRVTVAEAFAKSLNAAAVNVAMDVGLDAVIEAARELGIESDLTATPSLALGASEVTLLDMTEAYAAIRAGKAPIEAHGLAGFSMQDGQYFGIGTQADSEPLGALQRPLTQLLMLAVEEGTGQAARLSEPAAGKTGTTQEYRDAWFIGFNGQLVAGVWLGNDDNSPMNGVTGGTLPAEIWRRFMTGADTVLRDLESQPMPRDDGPPAKEGEVTVSLEEVPARAGFAARPAARTDGPTCNIRACSRAYRSFRAADCTFQPYRGPRKLCER
ncbi:PBP1A family penicillin-binding protein [Lutibaculum baratangense]|nr:PBP1A family penicillin-binding protein [Lutibaculum baratangense]